MSTQQHLDDHIIARYTAQPARLPPELRRQIESAWQGAPVQLYALADLDQSLRLTETWVALGPRHLAVARRAGEEWEIRSVERRLIQAYRAGGLIARVVRPAQAGTRPLSRAITIAWLAVTAMAAVYLVKQAAAYVRLRLMAILGEWVARDLRAELYEHIQRLSLAFFSRKRTGSLITRVSADTDRLWEFLAFGVVDVSL